MAGATSQPIQSLMMFSPSGRLMLSSRGLLSQRCSVLACEVELVGGTQQAALACSLPCAFRCQSLGQTLRLARPLEQVLLLAAVS